MSAPQTSALPLAERWQRYWYLQRVAAWLDPMPRKRRKPVLRELRSNLGAAAGEAGMSAAISDLGPPRALARQYLETEPRNRPTYYHGVAAVTGAIVLWVYALGLYVLGSLDTLLALGRTDQAELNFLGISITTEAHDTFVGATFTGLPWVSLIAFAV